MFMNYNSDKETFNFLEMGQELLKPLQIISNGELQLIIKTVHHLLCKQNAHCFVNLFGVINRLSWYTNEWNGQIWNNRGLKSNTRLK
jgi:hypothetical protein